MIVEAITLLLRQLNEYIAQADGPGAPEPGRVGQHRAPRSPGGRDRAGEPSRPEPREPRGRAGAQERPEAFPLSTGDVGYRNRPIHLNLFLLFTANYRNYGTALRRLAQVLTFFQGKQKFTFANSPGPNLPQAVSWTSRWSMDLLSLSFEEVNHLWGFLGTRESPFAIYRGRLVVISDQRLLETGGEDPGHRRHRAGTSRHDSLPAACFTSTSRTTTS